MMKPNEVDVHYLTEHLTDNMAYRNKLLQS